VPSVPNRESLRASDCGSEVERPFVSKVGVFMGESLLDDMEGCGEELMLRRACAPGGGCPKVMVEIIRPNGCVRRGLSSVVDRHWTSRLMVGRRAVPEDQVSPRWLRAGVGGAWAAEQVALHDVLCGCVGRRPKCGNVHTGRL
jgi:hypothetical protein